MRWWIGAIFLVGVSSVAIPAAPTFAANQTCTERQQVCFAYCEKTYNNAPKCTDACKEYLDLEARRFTIPTPPIDCRRSPKSMEL